MNRTNLQTQSVLSAEDLSQILNISRAGANQLLHRADFPTLKIGKRLLVPRDKLMQWIDAQTGGGQDVG